MEAHKIRRVPLFYSSASQESFDSPIDRRSDYYRQYVRMQNEAHPQPQPLMTAPNILTFLRVVLVPVFVALWHSPARHAPAATALVFITASVTDWLDGFLARLLSISTEFGAFLDPVADKLMVSTALVLLATAPPAPVGRLAMVVPVLLIIGREITMSSLREWAATSGGGAHKAVKVNSLGKWKTALQMVGLSALLSFRNAENLLGSHPDMVRFIHRGALASLALVWGGAFLGLWSLQRYMSNVWVHFVYPNGHPVHNPITKDK